MVTETKKTSKYFTELIFNILLFADDQFIISDTEDNLTKGQSIYYITYLKNIIWKLLQNIRKYLVSVGTDHLRTKSVINGETPEQVSQFTYPRCSIS